MVENGVTGTPEGNGEDIIEGRNAVFEAIEAGRSIDKIYLQAGRTDRTLARLESKARALGIVVVDTPVSKLSAMSQTGAHQGVIAVAAVREYQGVDDILAVAEERNEAPFIVVCDGIQDPQNLGAIIRTAEAAGVHGVIIPKRRSAGLTAAVGKASAGAAEHMAVARVPNIPAALKELKARGLWVYGTDADGDTQLHRAELSGPVCIVVGSEGEGLGRLVKETCDYIISIPMRGEVGSLNASVAAALVIYEVLRGTEDRA